MHSARAPAAGNHFWEAQASYKETIAVLTWTPKVCIIMAFWAIFNGFGPLFCILGGSRYNPSMTWPSLRGLKICGL